MGNQFPPRLNKFMKHEVIFHHKKLHPAETAKTIEAALMISQLKEGWLFAMLDLANDEWEAAKVRIEAIYACKI